MFQDMKVNCLAVINDTVGALMSCALDDRECAIGLILGKLPIDTVGALMLCALEDRECAIGLILGK